MRLKVKEAVIVEGKYDKIKLSSLIDGVIIETNGFQIFTQSYVMTQGGPNNASLFYVYYLYRESFQFMRMGNSCAIAWILFVIIMILTAILFKFQNRWVYYGGE